MKQILLTIHIKSSPIIRRGTIKTEVLNAWDMVSRKVQKYILKVPAIRGKIQQCTVRGNAIGKITNKMPTKKIYEKSSGNSQKNYPMYSERALQATATKDTRHHGRARIAVYPAL